MGTKLVLEVKTGIELVFPVYNFAGSSVSDGVLNYTYSPMNNIFSRSMPSCE